MQRSNAVAGFRPSIHGFRFANRWPSGPAREWHLGLVHVGIGDVGRGLCGGMAFSAAERFARGEDAAADAVPPRFGEPLFREIVDRQFDSFGTLFSVPARFAVAAFLGDRRLRRTTIRDAWPTIRRDIDAGRLSMIGLVRRSGLAVAAPDFGHQVVGYRYAASAERVAIGVYDPNHPLDDTVELVLERSPSGEISLRQTTGEPLRGLLALPWQPSRRVRRPAGAAAETDESTAAGPEPVETDPAATRG